jgi:hypothetical protein
MVKDSGLHGIVQCVQSAAALVLLLNKYITREAVSRDIEAFDVVKVAVVELGEAIGDFTEVVSLQVGRWGARAGQAIFRSG